MGGRREERKSGVLDGTVVFVSVAEARYGRVWMYGSIIDGLFGEMR